MFDRMPPEKLARAKGQAKTTNRRNALAHQANGFDTSRAEQARARADLVAEVGERKANKLIKEAQERVVPRRGWFS